MDGGRVSEEDPVMDGGRRTRLCGTFSVIGFTLYSVLTLVMMIVAAKAKVFSNRGSLSLIWPLQFPIEPFPFNGNLMADYGMDALLQAGREADSVQM